LEVTILAFALAETGRTDEALGLIQAAVAEADKLPEREARYIRAGEAYIDRRYGEAEQAYRDILERFPYETEARYFLAYTLWSMERYDDEIEELEILVELEPESASVWSMLGEAHLFLGELSLAITELQEYVRLQPDSPNGHHLLADAYRAQGELDLAASEYSKALKIDPRFHYSTVSLAVVEFLSGRSTEASQRLQALVDDEDAPPRNRIDGGFELSSVLRSEQRFRDAEEILESLEAPIAGEQVREAMSLSTRGTCWMEIGESERAGRLIDQSIRASPGVPTRYLFARGLLELRQGELSALEATVLEILEGALPADDPDRTEDKAAAFLRGSALLAQEEVDGAIEELTRAVALEGYEYGVYRLGLARAFRAAGRLQEAMAAARQAATEREPADPRLDLELDRRRARLELAEVQLAMNRPDEAAAEASEVLEVWSEADPNLPDLVRARELVQAGN
jgi:tetratricopeptide (TPR) repeat protein